MTDEKKSRLQLLEEKKAALEAKLKEEKERVKRRERKLLADENKKKRKALTRSKIEYGGLVEIAGLIGTDKGTLLGLLMAGARQLQEKPDSAAAWKRQGDMELAKRESARKKAALFPSTEG